LRLLGFDFGTRNIGVAVGQMITRTAQPLQNVNSQNGRPDWNAIAALISEWNPQALVVGVPYHLDGRRQPMTEIAERFCRQLEGRFGLPVYRSDERLSSVAAAEIEDNKHSIDALAARIILEDWMSRGSTEP